MAAVLRRVAFPVSLAAAIAVAGLAAAALSAAPTGHDDSAPDLAELPERAVLLHRVQLQPPEQRRSGRLPPVSPAARITTRTSATAPSTQARQPPRSSVAEAAASPRATRPRTGYRPSSWARTTSPRSTAIVYYVNRSRQRISAPPKGLMMIAGNAEARSRQPKGIVAWSCGAVGGTPRFATIPSCREDQMLQLQATFPNCWDGRRLDSADHKQHLSTPRRVSVRHRILSRCRRSSSSSCTRRCRSARRSPPAASPRTRTS